jgi:hypothetical protein
MRVIIMEDRTPIYLLSIVGLVALVAVVYMITGTSNQADTNVNYGNAITGNVITEDIEPVSFAGFGRFIIGVALIGACVYLYRKVE